VFSQIHAYRKALKGRDGFEFKYVRRFENMNTPNYKLHGLTQPQFMMRQGFLMMVGTSEAYIPRMEYFRKKDPLLIYSMWKGYIDKENYPDTYNEGYGRLYDSWRHFPLHTGGHATVEDIEKMIHAVNAELIVPIHTTKKNDFKNLNTGSSVVRTLNDGDELAL
jgi:ribonuclease J